MADRDSPSSTPRSTPRTASSSAAGLRWWRRPVVRLYGLGHGALLAGAAGTSLSASLWPLALGASAALMCTVPVVRELARRRRR